MNIDFPLILVILVFGSGLIWVFDALVLARPRQAELSRLQGELPGWELEGSEQAAQYQAKVADRAAEPQLVEYAKSFFPVLLVVFVLRSFLVEPFQIPSSSMVPTLQVGDYILVNKFTYGIRLPVIRTKVLSLNKPERGDVMVFFPPHQNETYFIKRVIGLPGDKIAYRDKNIYVNDELVPREYLATLPEGNSRYQLGMETLGDARYIMQNNDLRQNKGFSTVVPKGHYFMMGDNRDNSSDSRFWGTVKEKDIVGKAFAIWMHWDSLFSMPSFSRVGTIK